MLAGMCTCAWVCVLGDKPSDSGIVHIPRFSAGLEGGAALLQSSPGSQLGLSVALVGMGEGELL
jgi:hypothetical protein